ncbi:MAG: hypothetical protein R8K48_01700 [Gallionella sp.]
MTNELEKCRELLFTAEPSDQASRAFTLLSGLADLQVELSNSPHALTIGYHLRNYTLASLEHALEHEGFQLEHTFLHQIGRNIIYYCEDTARHNMEIRGHPTKKNEKDVFVEVSSHHPHKEHVIKPPELREFE